MGLSTVCSCRALFIIVAFGCVSLATCVEVLGIRGENTTLVCQGKSTTETIDWISESRKERITRKNTTNSNYPRFSSVGNHSAGEYNLHIADLRDDDAGIYYCSNADRYPLQELRILNPIDSENVLSNFQTAGNVVLIYFQVTLFGMQMLPKVAVHRNINMNSNDIELHPKSILTKNKTNAVTWTYVDENLLPGVYSYRITIYPGSFQEVYTTTIIQQGSTLTNPRTVVPLAVVVILVFVAALHSLLVVPVVILFNKIKCNGSTLMDCGPCQLKLWPIGCVIYAYIQHKRDIENNSSSFCTRVRHWIAAIPCAGAVWILCTRNFNDGGAHSAVKYCTLDALKTDEANRLLGSNCSNCKWIAELFPKRAHGKRARSDPGFDRLNVMF